MKLMKTLKNLCTPALVYLVISLLALSVILFQNLFTSQEFCLGTFTCPTSNVAKIILFLFELLYVVFWTWILTLICKSGYKSIAWAIVLFPIILMFLILGMFILQGNLLIVA